MLAASTAALATLPALNLFSDTPPAAQRKIAVTIDDGPVVGAGDDLDAFLKISRGLREAFVEERVPAIMFVNERQLNVAGQRDARAAVLNEWLDAGLELGNHTYSHPRLDDLELHEYLDNIVKGEVITRPLLRSRGQELVWYRYPFLATGRGENAKVIEDFLKARGYRIAPVTVDYADYRYAMPYARHLRVRDHEQAKEYFGIVLQVLDEAFTRAEQRSIDVLGYELPQILLIHCNEMNAVTLRTSLQRIRERGYEFVSLDEAMRDPAYNLPNIRPGGLGGGGWFNTLKAAKEA